MLDTSIPEDSPAAILDSVFNREPTTNAVAIAHGYGIQVKVKDNHLVIKDGIGDWKRERRWPKVDRTLKRIVVTGQTGYISIEASHWCDEHGISIITLDLNGNPVRHHATDSKAHDIRILCAQVRAIDTPRALEIAKEIDIRKLHGQARNLETMFSDYDSSAQVFKYAKAMDKAKTVASLMGIEGRAANTYFAPWESRVVPQWNSKSLARIPSNWLAFAGRNSPIRSGSGHRVATDPISAMLNYGYALGYAEARASCIATGLDPRIGFLHHGKSVNLAKRDSLALDVLEVIRPAVDAYVVGLVRSRVFSYRDFTEPYGYDPGTCRIVAPLTHEIAEQSVMWSEMALETAHAVAGMLA